jgi:hypothetical protein
LVPFICRLHFGTRALGQSSNYDYQATNQSGGLGTAAPQACEGAQPASAGWAKTKRGVVCHATAFPLTLSLDARRERCGALEPLGIPSSGVSAEAQHAGLGTCVVELHATTEAELRLLTLRRIEVVFSLFPIPTWTLQTGCPILARGGGEGALTGQRFRRVCCLTTA